MKLIRLIYFTLLQRLEKLCLTETRLSLRERTTPLWI